MSDEQKKSVLFVQSKFEPPCLQAVKQAVAASPSLDLMEASSAPEVAMIATDDWFGIIILIVNDRNDLLSAMTLLGSNTRKIKVLKTVRVIVVNKIPHPKVTSLLQTQGCAEILDFRVSGKAFMHKLQTHLKLVRKPCAEGSDDEAVEETLDEEDNEALSPIASDGVRENEALSHPADYWIIRGKSDVKKVMGRWLVEAVGPGPSAGEWDLVPIQGSRTKGSTAWCWKPRLSDGPFATPGGVWIFYGRQPEFDWRLRRWRFVGDRPSLTFQEEGKVVATRFSAENADALTVARVSSQAQARLPQIEASLAERIGASSKDPQSSDDEVLRFEHEEKKTTELNGRFSKNPDGVELSGTFSNEEAADWNNQAGEDAQAADWIDHDARRQNVFNAGRGLTQGHKSESITYDEDDFSTGVDAFKPVGLHATLAGIRADVLESSGERVKVALSRGALKPGQVAELRIVTENLQPSVTIQSKCKVIAVETCEPSDGGLLVEIAVDSSAAKQWSQVGSAVERRQSQIIQFMKLVRGA